MALYLATPKACSELAALSDWSEVAAGADAIVTLVTRLHAEMHEGARPGRFAVLIERVDDLVGTSAESSLQALVKACVDSDQFIVAEGETMFFSSSFGLPGLLKTSRSGLALQPEGIEGQTVFRSGFPVFTRADIPRGRGFLVERGHAEMLQVAMPG